MAIRDVEKNYILAIDLGTTSCKAVVFNTQGKLIGKASCEVPIIFSDVTQAEVNPADWEKSAVICIKKVLKDYEIPVKRILVVGLCGLMHAPVLVDKQGNSTCNSQIWMDYRCKEQTKWLLSNYAEKIREITGILLTVNYTAPKLRWIVENNPEILSKTYKILFPKDFIRLKLTNTFMTDISDTDGTALYNLKERNWSEELLDLIGIPLEKMPYVCDPTKIAGRITSEAEAKTGLKKGIPVIVGSSDSCSTFIGGNIFSNMPLLNLGTSAWIARYLYNKGTRLETKLPFVKNGSINWIGSTTTTGAVLGWFNELFMIYQCDNKKNSTISYKKFDGEAASIKEGANGLIFIPHLMGERGTECDNISKGAIFGLTLFHRRKHIFRSILEGTAFSIKYIIDSSDTKKFNEMVVVGGGAESKLWLQIISNITNKILLIPEITEAGALGVAIMAGKGIGLFDNIIKKSKEFVKISGKITPEIESVEKYKHIYDSYLALNTTFIKNQP